MRFPWRPAGALAAAILAGLAWWAGEVDARRVTLAKALAEPAVHTGSRIDVFREAKVIDVCGERAIVCERAYGNMVRAYAYGVEGPVVVGASISLRGTFTPPDRIDCTASRVHATRFWKVWVSLPVLAWIAWLVAVRLRVTRAGVDER